MRKLDLAGKRYGRLVLMEVVGTNLARQRVWACICDCGKEHQASQAHLTTGKITSCGCYRKEKATKHGMTRTPEWFAYQHAKSRCKVEHPKHEHYFDRGITFKFTSFEEFYAEIGNRPSPKHSLDREDNDKGYESGNVRWATKSQQERNRRCDNCILLKQRIAELEEKIKADMPLVGDHVY
jgi:hypothetical protein